MRQVRYALRQLRKAPGFSITVIITLALCVGANTAVFSVIDALFFRPLPYPHPDRLLRLVTREGHEAATDIDTSQTGTQFELARDHGTLFDTAVYGSSNGVNLYAGGEARYVIDQRVGASLFRVLGVSPLIGRSFTAAEDSPNGPDAAVISYQLWRTVFHGDPGVVGRTIDLRGRPHTVVGVMPEKFQSLPAEFGPTEPAAVWTPLRASRDGEGSGSNYAVVLRLKAGVPREQAQSQITAIFRDYIQSQHLPSGVVEQELVLPLKRAIVADTETSAWVLWAAVALVLVLGCANIGGLYLSRAASRAHEFATRLALGATRGRIASDVLLESVLLGVAGGIFGLAAGSFALDGLLRLAPPGMFLFTVHLDVRELAIMVGVSGVTGILFGLAPALESSRIELSAVLAENSRTNAGSRRLWKRQLLVFGEIAIAVVLVVSAGLLVRTFATLAGGDPGFDSNHLVVATASMDDARYAEATAGAGFYERSLERIRQIPGVVSAAVELSPPYGRPLNDFLSHINGREVGKAVDFTYATPGIFETLGMHLLRGRGFSLQDGAQAQHVAVVNETFARQFLSRTDPLGAELRIDGANMRVVGVVNDIREKNGLGPGMPVDRLPEVYVPAAQFPPKLFAMTSVWFSPVWVVRVHGQAGSISEALQNAVRSVDPRIPFSSFQTMNDLRSGATAEQRFEAVLFTSLGALSLLLAAVGMYGLLAQAAAQRKREVGIRMALGATFGMVLESVLLPASGLCIAGIAAGCVGAAGATRFLRSLIWGVKPLDPATFASVALLLLAVALCAALIPALRLARTDPAGTLR